MKDPNLCYRVSGNLKKNKYIMLITSCVRTACVFIVLLSIDWFYFFIEIITFKILTFIFSTKLYSVSLVRIS